MLIAGRSTSAAQADEHAVRDADVRTVVGVLLSKFVRSYDHDQPLVSAAPAGPLWNIKCVQVLFEMWVPEVREFFANFRNTLFWFRSKLQDNAADAAHYPQG